jgi:hypothetical protein
MVDSFQKRGKYLLLIIILQVAELGLTKGEAESALKTHEGDIVAAINYLIAH